MTSEGELQSVDGYMNIALEQTKEIVGGRVRRNYGEAFIRGNNGTYIPPSLGRKNMLMASSSLHLCRQLSSIDESSSKFTIEYEDQE